MLLMSVTLAVAAVRLARQNTLVQQMGATEALAAVDTICVDKTGTLTDGSLKLIRVEVADPAAVGTVERALGTFAASVGERNRTLETIAEAYPAHPERPAAEVPFSSQWKWSGLTVNGSSWVIGAPDVLGQAGALRLPEGLQRALAEHTSAGRRVIAFGEARGSLPADPATEPPPRLEPRALIVLEETLRPDAAETLVLHARAAGRPEADLWRRPRDRHRRRAGGGRARRRRGDRGPAAPVGQAAASRLRPSTTRSSAGSPPNRRRRWSGRSRAAADSRR